MNGLVILIDRETHTLWDHVTGQAVDGPLKGHHLDVWSIQMTTVRAALLEHPNLEISLSSYLSLRKWLAGNMYPKFIHANVFLPFFFRWTMKNKPDPRLPELTQGLGVILDGRAKYYPLEMITSNGIEDRWLNRTLQVQRGKIDGVPRATWAGLGEQPMQLLTRWYGFSFTYPDCEIYKS